MKNNIDHRTIVQARKKLHLHRLMGKDSKLSITEVAELMDLTAQSKNKYMVQVDLTDFVFSMN